MRQYFQNKKYSRTTKFSNTLPLRKTSQECETALTSQFNSLEKKELGESWKQVDSF